MAALTDTVTITCPCGTEVEVRIIASAPTEEGIVHLTPEWEHTCG